MSEEDLSDENCVRALRAHPGFRTLMDLEPERPFNAFRVFQDIFRENPSSRFLAFVFHSDESHGLGLAAFRALTSILDLDGDPEWKAALGKVTKVESVLNWCTDQGRFLDILLKGYDDSAETPVLVLGFENKLGAREQPNQLRDYQAALVKEYFDVPRALIFLTPDGREPDTANSSLPCKIHRLSHARVSRSFAGLTQAQIRFEPTVKLVLDSYASFMTEDEDLMAKPAQALIKQLLSDPESRKAIGLIQQYSPRLRPWIEDLLLPELNKSTGLQGNLAWAYPKYDQNPHEINLDVGELNTTLAKKGIFTPPSNEGIYFMLKAGRTNHGPAIVGDTFDLLLMVYGNTEKRRREIISVFEPLQLPPTSAAHRQWGPWTCLWAGQSHTLRDAGLADAQAVAHLVQDAVKTVYPLLIKAVGRQ